MTVYTVHEPRPRRNEDTTAPDRFVFVRDGFYFWAFLLGPLWLLWRRLWLVLLLYLVVTAAIQAGLWALGMSGTVKFIVGFLVALLVGFEAASLWRWTYARRRWKNLGLVVGSDRETAERRFFDTWIGESPVGKAGMAASPPMPPLPEPYRVASTAPDVIGLFPEPQSRP